MVIMYKSNPSERRVRLSNTIDTGYSYIMPVKSWSQSEQECELEGRKPGESLGA